MPWSGCSSAAVVTKRWRSSAVPRQCQFLILAAPLHNRGGPGWPRLQPCTPRLWRSPDSDSTSAAVPLPLQLLTRSYCLRSTHEE